ncbi:His/Gly/Thr/Pro-type tRNA ligase C-terminal domain-containing protein [Rossellomorea sp. H39__3]
MHFDYAKEVQEKLQAEGLRVDIDDRNEKIGYKIREAQMSKVPYMLVVGDNEIKEKAVNVRKYGEQKSETLSFDAFADMVKSEAKRG